MGPHHESLFDLHTIAVASFEQRHDLLYAEAERLLADDVLSVLGVAAGGLARFAAPYFGEVLRPRLWAGLGCFRGRIAEPCAELPRDETLKPPVRLNVFDASLLHAFVSIVAIDETHSEAEER